MNVAARPLPALRQVHLSKSEIAALNRVCAPFADLSFDTPTGAATLRSGDTPPPKGSPSIEMTLDGHRCVLTCPPGVLLAPGACPWSDALRQEMAWETLLTQIEALGHTVEFTSQGRSASRPAHIRLLEIEMARERHPVALAFDTPAVPVLAELFARLPPATPPGHLPCLLAVRLGGFILTRSELADLRPGSVLVNRLDALSDRRGRLVVQGVIGGCVTLDGPRLKLEESPMKTTMPPPNRPRAVGPPGTVGEVPDLTDLPVKLDFVAGAHLTTMSDLQGLAPGSIVTFDGDPMAGDIDIRVHGVSIGQGEAVLIGGRMCLQITAMHAPATPTDG